MTGIEVLLVGLAGAAGAVLRHELTRGDRVRATATLNITGAGLLGLCTVAVAPGVLLVVGGGLLGSATTFSTWMVQADDATSPWRVVAWPLVLGVASAAAGRLLGTGLGLAP